MNSAEILGAHSKLVVPLYAAPSSRTRNKLWPLLVHTLSVFARLRAAMPETLSDEQQAQIEDLERALSLQLLRLEPADELDPNELQPDAWRDLVGDGQNLPLAVGPHLLLLAYGQPVTLADFYRPGQPNGTPHRSSKGIAIIAIIALIALGALARR